MLGLACGDALGSTIEFTRRDSHPEVCDLIGGGPFQLEPGQWTDDTSMALCLAGSLIACHGFDADDLLKRFVAWWRDGTNSVTGHCFDIGNTTQSSLYEYEATRLLIAGPDDDHQAGNGSLMRMAPVAIFAGGDSDEAERLAMLQSQTTHPAPVAHEACRLFARKLTMALNGATKDEVMKPADWTGSAEITGIAACGYRRKSRRDISSSGYVVHTLEAAMWAIDKSETLEDAVILAANLGDDSDTVGAVTGALAGAIWGVQSIPDRWLAKLAWREHLVERVDALILHKA